MARLPWTQLGAAFDLAPRLEGLLGVSYLEALGLLAQLDRVAVELAELGLFPGARASAQLAPAVRWPAARAEELVKALVEVGKVEAGPEGVRVLGLEWAVKALASQVAARERAARSTKLRESARSVRESAALDVDQDLDQDEKQLPPPAGAAGIPVSVDSSELKEGLLVEPSGAAGELPLGIQIAPGATVATKAAKTRAKKPDASQEPTSAPTRELSDALCADFEELMCKKYAFKGGRDGPALPKLLELAGEGGIPEIRARFRWGIDPRNERDGGPPWAGRIATIVELADHKRWNALARAPALPVPASDFEGGFVENHF